MKKFISFVMAAVLCVGMTTTVLAANSATTGTASPDVDNSTVVNVKDAFGDVTQADGTKITLKTWVEAGVPAEVVATLPTENSSSAWVSFATAQKVEIAEVDDVVKTYVPEGTKGTVPVPVAGVKATDNVKALVFKNGIWNVVAAVAKDGVVEITSDNFCPVIILIDADPVTASAPTPAPTPVVTPSTPVAPKTADVAMFGLCAVAALAGVVTTARKAKASK